MKSTLTEFEIRELILKYQSELKKLNYQVDVLKKLINNLEGSVDIKVSKTKEDDLSFDAISVKPVQKQITVTKAKAKVEAKAPVSKVKKSKTEGKGLKKGKTSSIATKQAPAPKFAKPIESKKKSLKGKASAKTVAPAKKGKKGGKKSVVAKAQTGKTKKQTKEAENKGYKLSTWDKLVVDSITVAQKALTTYEIINYIKSKAKENKLSDDDTLVKNKVVRSLQKLANRRHDISKADYKGKGFVYALPAWVDSQGKLDKNFK